MEAIRTITEILVFSPLAGAIISGLFAKKIGPRGAHYITISYVFCAFVAACVLVDLSYFRNMPSVNFTLYNWL